MYLLKEICKICSKPGTILQRIGHFYRIWPLLIWSPKLKVCIHQCFFHLLLGYSIPNFEHCRGGRLTKPMFGVTHISNLPTACVKITVSSTPTHPVPFTSKCLFCRKSMFLTSDIKLVKEF